MTAPAPMGVPGWALQGMLCPRCGHPAPGSQPRDYDGLVCLPRTCSSWRTVGKSRNGGPMLELVDP